MYKKINKLEKEILLNNSCEDGAHGGEPRPPQLSCMGTQSSNTVPSNCINTSNTKILRTGIDSLYLSYQGQLSEESSIRLSELKKRAQSSDPKDVSLAQIALNGHIFEVSDRGRNPYAFVLNDNWYQISVSKLGAIRVPLSYIRLSSELLAKQGSEIAVSNLSGIIASLGNTTEQPAISRVDLCVDFVTDFPLSEIKDADWVTRADVISTHSSRRRFSGCSIGSGGEISARLYNKTVEMKKVPRPYLEQIHRDCGWDGQQDVWRLEFQFMREAVRELGIKYFSELGDSLSALWQYATREWLRLTIPSETDLTQSRWPEACVWKVLQAAQWSGDKELSRVSIDKGRPPSDQSLFINGMSGITSFMAREGYVDPIEGVSSYLQSAKKFHDNREYMTGFDFHGYLAQKIALKVKSYNTYQNMPDVQNIHPSDKAVADEYRKQSDGD